MLFHMSCFVGSTFFCTKHVGGFCTKQRITECMYLTCFVPLLLLFQARGQYIAERYSPIHCRCISVALQGSYTAGACSVAALRVNAG